VFGLPETIVILLICLIGGEGEPLGIPIGIAIVFLLPKALPLSVAAGELRKLSVMLGANPPDSSAVVSSLQQATLGVLLVVFITLLRRGVIPSLRASLHAGSPSK
jgi:ABC-type branched-subunit amino acid transport system permease subunit